jgi:alkylation response protein AidB-like acyl-CoA dehydrogenase
LEAQVELELTSDQDLFAETTRKYLEDKAPVTTLRAARDDPSGFDPGFWAGGTQLGWTSLLVREEDGGGSISGRPLADLALIAFEFGSHAAPGPLVPASIVAGTLSRSGSSEQRSGPLQGMLAGEEIGTWALSEPRPHDGFGDVALTVEETSAGIRLVGVKAPVESAAQAQQLLVTARTGDRLTQVLVPTGHPGVTITPMGNVDLTRRFAKVTLDVELPASAVVGEIGAADADVERQSQIAVALETAQMVGAMDRVFAMTLEWSFDRYTFGRPIASYQELKHRFADMKMWLEASHAIADSAVRAFGDASDDTWDLLSSAKSYVGHYGTELMHDCVQIHGGIGVTFEHDLHLYLRRVVLGAGLYGSVAEHRERLTAALEGEAA